MHLVYFAPVKWDSYDQRPHYVVRHFLSAGGRTVLWVDPYPARLPRRSDLDRIARRDPPLPQPRPEGLTVLHARGWPIDPVPGGVHLNRVLFWRRTLARIAGATRGRDTILGVGRPTGLALSAFDAISHADSFYDAMDDFPEFYHGRSRRSTRAIEHHIAARVNRVLASSVRLVEKFTALGTRVVHVPNAFDMALLPWPPPARPVSPQLGFIGCMGRWFDWPLVRRLAEAVRPMPVALVGPQPVRPPAGLPSNLMCHPPVHQREGIEWLGRFSAGLIPFTRTRLTDGIDPIKYYQYRGAGLPVLATRFGDMAARAATPGVFMLDDGPDLAATVERALASPRDDRATWQFRLDHTWTARFEAARLFDPQ